MLIIINLILTVFCIDSYVGFGFTGGSGKSKIKKNEDSKFLPNGELKNSALLTKINKGFEELDPNYIARAGAFDQLSNDSMISRASFLTRPVPDAVKEKILKKNDERDAVPFDYTQGFVPGPNDHEMTQSSENLIATAKKLGLSFSNDKKPKAQALVMDPDDPTKNMIIDMPAGSNYYPWNNPYVIVSSDGPIKMKEKDEDKDKE
ncbi:hypothetical protein GVAV_000985 [Gurleya vavrai]